MPTLEVPYIFIAYAFVGFNSNTRVKRGWKEFTGKNFTEEMCHESLENER